MMADKLPAAVGSTRSGRTSSVKDKRLRDIPGMPHSRLVETADGLER